MQQCNEYIMNPVNLEEELLLCGQESYYLVVHEKKLEQSVKT
jgi:hypothetical protein